MSQALQPEVKKSLIQKIENINRAFISKISNTVLTYKKTTIFFLLSGTISYYIYRKYLKDMISIYYEFKNLEKLSNAEQNKAKESDTASSPIEKFELTFNNLLPKLLQSIEKQIQQTYSLDETFKQINNKEIKRSVQELEALWNLLKTKVFISLISSVIVSRVILVISQVQFLLLEKVKQKYGLNKPIIDSIFSTLWEITSQYIEFLVKNIENKINSYVTNNIMLRNKYSSKDVIKFISDLRDKVEEVDVSFSKDSNDTKSNNNKGSCGDKSTTHISLVLLHFYLNRLETKITELERSEYNIHKETEDNNRLLFNSIKYYCELYDILNSSVTSITIQNGFDHDFLIINDMVEKNFEIEKEGSLVVVDFMSMSKITSFVYNIKNQVMNKDNSIFNIKTYGNSEYSKNLDRYVKIFYE